MHPKDSTIRPLVLVVDDDEMLRVLTRTALEGAGFRVSESANGAGVTERVSEERPDLVLMDVMMPDVDGFMACAQLRATAFGQHVPVLMMTGLEDSESVLKAYEAGATDFINKPINYTLLAFRVRYMLRSKKNGDDLRSSQALLTDAQAVAGLEYWQADRNGRFLTCSDKLAQTLNLAGTENTGSFADLLRITDESDRARLREHIREALFERHDYELEHRMLSASGEVLTVYQQVRWGDDSDGQPRLLGIIQDITKLRRAEQQVQQLAFYDPVTRLPNRVLLQRRAHEAMALARRSGTSVAILSIDIDDFKRINSSLGHEVGTRLIGKVARRLRKCVRETDELIQAQQDAVVLDNATTLARPAGDEFTVVLIQAEGPGSATQVARRILDAFETPFTVDGKEVVLRLSIGISTSPEDGQSAEELLKHADTALRFAKADALGGFHFYRSSMNARAAARMSMEMYLRRALEEGGLELYLQPKLRAHDAYCIGMEALLRWEHPELGRVSPADFIPVAEETGLIIPIGDWILDEACRMTSELLKEGLDDLVCAVNISVVQFANEGLSARIEQALRAANLDAHALELELTESMLMDDVDAATAVLDSLRGLGLSLAIDDFGTGFSSLNYLKRLPVDTLKVDQSFVRELRADNDDAAIVSAVIAMAHSLRMKVVAEGVETDLQMQFLRERQCDVVQGYLYSPPLPFAAFRDWLKDSRSASKITAAPAVAFSQGAAS